MEDHQLNGVGCMERVGFQILVANLVWTWRTKGQRGPSYRLNDQYVYDQVLSSPGAGCVRSPLGSSTALLNQVF